MRSLQPLAGPPSTTIALGSRRMPAEDARLAGRVSWAAGPPMRPAAANGRSRPMSDVTRASGSQRVLASYLAACGRCDVPLIVAIASPILTPCSMRYLAYRTRAISSSPYRRYPLAERIGRANP
jgi:hypothetical protein